MLDWNGVEGKDLQVDRHGVYPECNRRAFQNDMHVCFIRLSNETEEIDNWMILAGE
jgi:hypothetical protein